MKISLKKKVPSDLWDGKAGVVKGSGENVKFLNNYIAQVKAELFKIFNKMEILEEHITAEAIKLKFTGEKKRKLKRSSRWLNTTMTKMAQRLGVDFVQGTYAKYTSLHNKLVTFIKYQYKKSDIALRELNHKFVTSFEYFLKTYYKNGHNTAMKDIKNLKKVINLGCSKQLA